MFGDLFRKRLSPDEIGKLLAAAYQKSFSADTFHSFFGSTSLADGQTIDFALAEWHAFGTFSFTYCLWNVYGKRDKIFPILDSFQPAVLESLRLNGAAEKQFLAIASDREKEYVSQYGKVKNGTSMAVFYGRVIAHITGTFDPEVDALRLSQASDPILGVGLSRYAVEIMAATKSVILRLDPK